MTIKAKKDLTKKDQFVLAADSPLMGRPPVDRPANKKVISIHIDGALLKAVDQAAARRGISRAALISLSVSEFLGRA